MFEECVEQEWMMMMMKNDNGIENALNHNYQNDRKYFILFIACKDTCMS